MVQYRAKGKAMDHEQHQDLVKGFDENIILLTPIKNDVRFIANTMKAAIILCIFGFLITLFLAGRTLYGIYSALIY